MSVFVESRVRTVKVNPVLVRKFASMILSSMNEESSDLSVTFVGDQRMRRLNRRYRRKDKPTDVLAFAIRDACLPVRTRIGSAPLGDVVIAVPTAIRQARAAKRSLREEMAVLLIHGILHLCGYDHERGEREARRMHKRERTLLEQFGMVPPLVSMAGKGSR